MRRKRFERPTLRPLKTLAPCCGSLALKREGEGRVGDSAFVGYSRKEVGSFGTVVAAALHAAALKTGGPRDRIAAPEFFHELLRSVDDAVAALHARFRRIAALALATWCKSSRGFRVRRSSTRSCPPRCKDKRWWSCRGTAPRVRKARPMRSPGSASSLPCSNVRLKAGLTVRRRFIFSYERRITRSYQPEFMAGVRSGSGRLFASGD